MNRRSTLVNIGAALAFCSGCLSTPKDSTAESSTSGDSTSTTFSTSNGENTVETSDSSSHRTLATEPPKGKSICESQHKERVLLGGNDSYPDRRDNFVLESSDGIIELGEKIEFVFTNKGDKRMTGEIYKYNIQKLVDASWTSIFWTNGNKNSTWTDLGRVHKTGEGFTWPFIFKKELLHRRNDVNPPYYACSDITPGDYRFIYAGVEGYPLAKRFTVK